jgi:hypothetical protein
MTSLHGLVAIPSTDPGDRGGADDPRSGELALVNAIEELLEDGRERELDQARAAE